ncbi:acyl-CoA dehydrogenase family protein [Nocardia sp. NPDC050710]|uniref:acyl-CoA dehydrogenase family protein n=1 Tax=Nocardia sp. NPDC050710 TaxID=3157220 RepID=UPI0033DDAF8A
MTDTVRDDLRQRVETLLAEHDPGTTDAVTFHRARFDAGLAWVYFPAGLGGLGVERELQPFVDGLFEKAGAPGNNAELNGIGLGMAAPTIVAYGTPEQQRRFLRPLWAGEEIWCQLFSEPGAGSDLAAVGTRAVRDGEDWIVNGQKVWTSVAHKAQLAILVARTDPSRPKHSGLSYFICDMTDPGVDVRPLRQITGEAEFNEVFLTDVRIPDAHRLGKEGEGWRVATTTLNNERASIGGRAVPRESGVLGAVARSWRSNPDKHTPELHDRLLRLWVEAEAGRLAATKMRQQVSGGQPGPESSALKLAFARSNQQLSGLELEILGEGGLRYDDWTMVRTERVDFAGRSPGYRYLRAKGNSIEGGTSEILRNIVAERVLGLPVEARADKDIAWKDLTR